MKRSRGLRSVYSIVKEEFGLRGTKQRVLEDFLRMIGEAQAQMKLDLGRTE